METMKCYYDVTDKVNEIARQHAEKTAPVFRGWRHSYEVTLDTLIAGLSYFDKDGRFGDRTRWLYSLFQVLQVQGTP